MAPAGRRPGNEDTRAGILEAARRLFGERGFHAATIRAIADSAKVDPALVMHYFGSKEDLFAAAIELPMAPSAVGELVLADGIEGAGRRVAELFFSVWELPESRASLLALLRGAFAAEQGATALREFMGDVMVGRLAPAIDRPDAVLRAQLVASHLVGVAVLRYVVAFDELARVDASELIDIVAPRLQDYFTGV